MWLLTGALLFGLASLGAGPARAQGEGARPLTKAERKPTEPVKLELTKPPALLAFIPAIYPEAARAQGLEISVPLILTLDVNGNVSDASLAGSPAG